jgi:hypothetical protein
MTLVRVSIQNMDQVQAELRDINANQVPFATALALTKTAQGGQLKVRNDILPRQFTLRRVSWAKQGIRIQAATKQKLEATVQDINPYMDLQETGGDKLPYGSAIAVPLSGARPTLGALIADSDRPHAVMARGGFIRNGIMYAVALKAGRRGSIGKGIKGISKAASWDKQIVPMYALVPRASIKPRYGFADAMKQVVEETFAQNFSTAFAQAVRTAKR